MIDEKIKKEIFQLISNFLMLVNKRDAAALSRDFGVSGDVFDEIVEVLGGYLGENFSVEAPPVDMVFLKNNEGRINLDLFEMNAENLIGVECVIWSCGVPQEPILHAEVAVEKAGLSLAYRYIGS